jgi:hypothetical protein
MDPWYQFSAAVEEFNMIQQKRVAGLFWISVDESMSARKPRTQMRSTKYFISCLKAEATWKRALIACPITGILSRLEIQRGKQGMIDKKYNALLGVTAGFCIWACRRYNC